MTDEATEATSEEVVAPETNETESANEPVEAKGEATETEAEAPSGEESTETAEQPEKKNGLQDRFSQLTQRAKEAEARAEAAHAKAQEAEEQLRFLQQTQPDDGQADPYPELESCGYDDQLHKQQVMEWHQRQSDKSAQNSWKRQQEAAAQMANQAAMQARAQALESRVNAFSEQNPDMNDALNNIRNMGGVGPIALDVVTHSPKGAEVLYYLGKNPAVAAEVRNLPTAQAYMKLAEINARLSQPVAPKTTQAPAPHKPVGQKASSEKDPSKMSPEEYAAMRRKQKAAKS